MTRWVLAVQLLTTFLLLPASGSQGGGASLPSALIATAYSADFHTVHLENVPVPTRRLAPTEVLLRVSHSSVNPLDWELPTGILAKIFPLRFPSRLGMDVAGTVVDVGTACNRLRKGDTVFGTVHYGAFAQMVIATEPSLSFHPKRISQLEGATLPVVGLTSIQALQWAGAPWTAQQNQTVFVTNGAGGTGTTGIQAAKAFGAGKVIAVTSTPNVPFVTALGADEVIDYKKTADVWHQVPDESLDVVYDNLGLNGTVDKAMPKMKPGGRIVIIKGQLATHPRSDVQQTFLIMNSTRYADLDTLTHMVEGGQMKPHVQKTYGLTQWAEAFRTQQAGHVVGKLAVDVNA